MENLLNKIHKSYVRYVLTHGKKPTSVFLFMEELGYEEKSFYEHFASFEAIDNSIWLTILKDTLAKVKSEEVYQEYSIREKLLSFCYTLVEEMKNQRSFVVFCVKKSQQSNTLTCPDFLKGFKKEFKEYASELITEGTDTQEIASRTFITERYPDILWIQIQNIISFWVNDNSTSFEKTDQYIEKAVNLSFDILGRNAFDSAIDFAKFMFQK